MMLREHGLEVGAAIPHSANEPMTVAVIIPTHNQARFLGEAVATVLAQTTPVTEIIVVDDGSTDDPIRAIARYSNVSFIQQRNQGRSAARNAGLKASRSSHIVFLDADDRLLPHAIETGMRFAAKYPDCAFVYGSHRDIALNGEPLGSCHYSPVGTEPFIDFLRRNLVRMLASAIFRRDYLVTIGGFDEAVQLAEDYDLYLRLARLYPVVSHATMVAEYRWHGGNSSADSKRMLQATLAVLDRHERDLRPTSTEKAALRDGRAIWRDYYARLAVANSAAAWPSVRTLRLLIEAIEMSPRSVARALGETSCKRIKKIATSSLLRSRRSDPSGNFF
jgi:glycosyltransferase involved in cell wall biosynthesis